MTPSSPTVKTSSLLLGSRPIIGDVAEPKSEVSRAWRSGEDELSIRRLVKKYFSNKLKEL